MFPTQLVNEVKEEILKEREVAIPSNRVNVSYEAVSEVLDQSGVVAIPSNRVNVSYHKGQNVS